MKFSVTLFLLLFLFVVNSKSTTLTDTISLWEESPKINSNVLNTVIAVDSLIAVAAGVDGTILRTTNQGKSWNHVKNDSLKIFHKLTKDNQGILYMLESNGGVYGWNGILSSNDKGINWKRCSYEPFWFLAFNKFNNKFYGILNNSISISDDGCQTWNRFTLPTTHDLLSISFYDDSTFYVTGNSGILFYTSNAGKDWKKIAQGSFSGPLKCVAFNKDTVIVTGGSYDGIALVSKLGVDSLTPLIISGYPWIHSVTHSGKYWWYLKQEGVFYKTNAFETGIDPDKVLFQGWPVAPLSISWLDKTGIGYFVTETGRIFFTRNHGMGDCSLSIINHPKSSSGVMSGSIGFRVKPNDSTAKVQWQTKVSGLEWVNLIDNNTYRGTNSDSISIQNISVNNHNQQFRAIVNNNLCKDTSEIASLTILDTCIFKRTDTVKIAVSDTLIIKTKVTGMQENKYYTFLIYPNPASTFITVECGDNSELSSYSFTISNSLGQEKLAYKFTTRFQQIDISKIGGAGLYIISLRDNNNNVIETRKLLIN
jgi:photosystem II stability/assembly factor-like uncharacterized protein